MYHPAECPWQPLDLLLGAAFKAHQQVFLFSKAMVSSAYPSADVCFFAISTSNCPVINFMSLLSCLSDSDLLTLIAPMPNTASVQHLEYRGCSVNVYYNNEQSRHELRHFQTKEDWIRRIFIPNYLPRANLHFKRELFHLCSRKLTLSHSQT